MHTKKFWLDAGERLLATFVQAFVAALLVTGIDGTDALKAAAVAGLAATLSVIKSLAATATGDAESAGVGR